MVEERITDGPRIAELLAAELEGRVDDGLGSIAVRNVDPDVTPTADGARAFDVVRRADDPEADESDPEGDRLARAYVHGDFLRLEFEDADEVATETAASVGLDGRSADEPGSLVVDSGAAVKRATDVVQIVLSALDNDDR